jgi:hypothetical protein
VGDPGSYHDESVLGGVRDTVRSGALHLAGRSAQLDGSTQVLGSCNSPDALCEARVFLLSDGKSAANVFYWSTDRPVISVVAINTIQYR